MRRFKARSASRRVRPSASFAVIEDAAWRVGQPDLGLGGDVEGVVQLAVPSVVLVGGDNRIETLDIETGERTVIRGASEQVVSCVDPVDSTRVVFGLGTEHQIPDLWMLDLATGDEVHLGSVAKDCIINEPAVSPDATLVVVDAVCADHGGNGLWTIPVAGGTATAVLNENPPGAPHEQAVQYWIPQWTSDGASIVYHRSGSVPASLRIVGVDGANDRELVPPFACCGAVGLRQATDNTSRHSNA